LLICVGWKLGGGKEVRDTPCLSPLSEAQIQGSGKPKIDVGGLAHSQTPSIFLSYATEETL